MKNIFPSFAAATALVAALGALPLQAQASIFPDNEARKAILELREQLAAVNKRLDELNARVEGKIDKTAALDLSGENEQLRLEIARLRGQVEVLANELVSEQRRQKDFYADLDNRLRKMEPQRVAVDGKEFDISPNEQQSYDAALSLFKAGDYKAAGDALTQFLQRYPSSAYAPSAHYWLGNTHYVLGDYRNALRSHETVIQSYPDNAKVPEALLNVASSYTELKDIAAARKTLETLVSRYPNTEAAETARRRLGALPAPAAAANNKQSARR